MNCSEAEVLLHALIDGELDAGHAREVEAHLAACPACTEKLEAFGAMQEAMAAAHLKDAAPAHLRRRIEAAMPAPATRPAGPGKSRQATWRTFFGGLTIGTALSAAVAASLVIAVFRDDQNQQITSEIVSAHLRSLQANHLTDVETSDRHTVKPWFNGKIDVSPPVIDLTAQGFTLIGGRLDYIDGKEVASVVYRRREHVINLFVAQGLGSEHAAVAGATQHGFNVRHWTQGGLDFWAVSDINAGELYEFCQKLMGGLQPTPPPS
ncbi:MAG: anti-sigma factor [Xanthobacteraceae bacterium]|nr:anti-sigma factor [Xanthobacteraceae bacterium]